MKPGPILLLFISFISYFPSHAQDRQAYTEAVGLATDALTFLKNGDLKAADSLIKRSITVYPTTAIFDYALAIASLPDIAGSNQLMDRARLRVLSFKGDQLLHETPYNGLQLCNKYYTYFGFCLKAFEVNKVHGERSWIKYSLDEALKVSFPPFNLAGPDHYVIMQQALTIEKLSMEKKYFEAFSRMDYNFPGSLYSNPWAKAQAQITILCEMEDYMRAGQLAQNLLNTTFNNAAHSWLFYINTMLGRTDIAMQHFAQLPDFFIEANLNANYYVLALIDIQKKEYAEAIRKLNYSLSKRGIKGMEAHMLIEKWKVYKALGDAYAGLKFYNRARDNYKISLLAYPEYQPSIQAMASLVSNIEKEKNIDATGPVISILEPAPHRGLGLATPRENVMVKGVAFDPSGIQRVAINGNEVYSQAGGDFWGEVLLKEGVNKIRINSTDSAGNVAEMIFEIERKASIVPDTLKQGRNFAVLLAAQQYNDASIPSLDNPVSDAVKLKIILRNDYGFADSNIITLFNPGIDAMRSQLMELRNLVRPEDNVVIFYAGHGVWQEKEKKGYWLLTDSKGNDPSTWLSNKEMLELIAALPARHTLLITDACFSGSVFKTRQFDPNAPAVVQKMNEKISRIAITSGNDTEVPDESVFMKYLIRALSENREKYLTAQKMFVNHIIEAVMTETRTEPRYGTLELAGHVGGDYIFMKN